MKAKTRSAVRTFTDIPNIGPAIAKDFVQIGIKDPVGLQGKDAFTLYKKLCTKTGTRHDPCVLDTFMAAVDFMDGAPARPWWHYTQERKKRFPNI
ncbi:MAG: Mitomycin resistance protein [Parcubacteria bacterium C7867-001]|nr:MAG: Mitomycin resistance protein [Parcubacteria bacterium C7867-001]